MKIEIIGFVLLSSGNGQLFEGMKPLMEVSQERSPYLYRFHVYAHFPASHGYTVPQFRPS